MSLLYLQWLMSSPRGRMDRSESKWSIPERRGSINDDDDDFTKLAFSSAEGSCVVKAS